jgi:hypothetical protein
LRLKKSEVGESDVEDIKRSLIFLQAFAINATNDFLRSPTSNKFGAMQTFFGGKIESDQSSRIETFGISGTNMAYSKPIVVTTSRDPIV